jgi:hypothetical protein
MKNTKDVSEFKTLTIEELKSFDGLTDISRKEAEHIIHTLKELSLLTHQIITEHEQSSTISNLRKAE